MIFLCSGTILTSQIILNLLLFVLCFFLLQTLNVISIPSSIRPLKCSLYLFFCTVTVFSTDFLYILKLVFFILCFFFSNTLFIHFLLSFYRIILLSLLLFLCRCIKSPSWFLSYKIPFCIYLLFKFGVSSLLSVVKSHCTLNFSSNLSCTNTSKKCFRLLRFLNQRRSICFILIFFL